MMYDGVGAVWLNGRNDKKGAHYYGGSGEAD